VPGAFSFAGSIGFVGMGQRASSGRISAITHHNGLASLGRHPAKHNKTIDFT